MKDHSHSVSIIFCIKHFGSTLLKPIAISVAMLSITGAQATADAHHLLTNHVRKFTKRLPRRARSQPLSQPLSQPPSQRGGTCMRRGPVDEDGVFLRTRASSAGSRRRLARAPATQQPTDDRVRPTSLTRSAAQADRLVNRLRAGRTLSQLQLLMDWNLFQAPCAQGDAQPLSPKPGLFAQMQTTQPVFIIGTYSRYGVKMADAVRLRPLTSSSDGQNVYRAVVSCVRSVRQTELQDVGLHFKLRVKALPRNFRTLSFVCQVGPSNRSLAPTRAMVSKWLM